MPFSRFTGFLMGLLATSAMAQSTSPKLVLHDMGWAGGGCSDDVNGVKATVAPDGNGIELSMPKEFAVAAGPERVTIPLKCLIYLDIEFPGHLKCAISAIAFDGVAELDRGTSVQHFARAWFDDPLNDAIGYYSTVLHGPRSGSYHGISSPLADPEMSWSGCPAGSNRARRRLVIDTTLFAQVRERGARAFLRGENSETEKRVLQVKWKKCSP